jgi:ethanolamine utilization protein EutJ
MEKVASIVLRHIQACDAPVDSITLVGGPCAYPGMAKVIEKYAGIATHVPDLPVYVTPIGIAMHDQQSM